MRKPWTLLPAQLAHDVAPWGLKVASLLWGSSEPLRFCSREWQGLTFPNPVGVAGGVDKTVHSLSSWWKLGAGFIELGTVTPLPQKANPGPIMARDLKAQILWNRMGFPSPGADVIAARLEKFKRPYPSPLFVNVGKNRTTPLDQAAQDYIMCMQKLERSADAFVLNISSPNTSGLRELQSARYFQDFLSEILERAPQTKPVLVKVSPDMSDEQLQSLIKVIKTLPIAGLILTNTTLERPKHDHFPAEGGFSGAQVREKSVRTLTQVVRLLGDEKKRMLLVSVGGILTASDIKERLSLGADLVQVYSALVFEGPRYFQKIARQLHI